MTDIDAQTCLLCVQGPNSLRLAWGNTQEASALFSLMHCFPKSGLLECGLFLLDLDKLPRDWGFKIGDLPPLGASPDGLLHHSSLPDMEGNIAGAEGNGDHDALAEVRFPWCYCLI